MKDTGLSKMVSADAVALHVVNNWPLDLWPKSPFEYYMAWLTEFQTFMESEVVNVHPPSSAFFSKDTVAFATELFLACKSIAKMRSKMASLKKGVCDDYNKLCAEFQTTPIEAQCVANFIDFNSWSVNHNSSAHFHAIDNWLLVRIKALFSTEHWQGLFNNVPLAEQSGSEDGGEDDEEDELMESSSDEEESDIDEESDASEDQESDGEDATAPTNDANESKDS
tara:strand:- start:333 stop:1004 length:672 start_codon:yes stop_codon:yes gene_type:complete